MELQDKLLGSSAALKKKKKKTADFILQGWTDPSMTWERRSSRRLSSVIQFIQGFLVSVFSVIQ